jgi:serine/threonine-protein kinase RsbW
MKYSSHIIISAQLNMIGKAVRFIVNNAVHFGFPQERIKDIELASEEAIVNIISYAYTDTEGEIEIHCLGDETGQFIIKIIDSGTPFDVRELPLPEIPSDITDCKVGGLGIFLIKMVADNIDYEHKNNKNILSMTFRKIKSQEENKSF